MSATDIYVFDTTPLTHLARAGLLPVLRLICEDVHCFMLKEVVNELRHGLDRFPENNTVLDASWIKVQQLQIDEFVLFAAYTERIGAAGGRDVGECATLAWAEARGAVAILDDQVARNAAEARGVEVHGTVWLITRGLKQRMLTESDANEVANRLLDTNIRFPFRKGEYSAWIRKEGLLE